MAYIISNIELVDYKFKFEEFYISWSSPEVEVYKTEKHVLVIEGFLYDLEKKRRLLPGEVSKVILSIHKTKKVLPENITGQYNLVFIQNGIIDILNDFVGMYPLYYSISKEKKVVSNSIYEFLNIGFAFDDVGVIQSFLGPFYTSFNARTFVDTVSQLRAGEYLSFNADAELIQRKIDSSAFLNQPIKKRDREEIITSLKENAQIYNDSFNEILLPISGGVDTRITLSSFVDKSKIKTLSYGEPSYIDNKIAKDLADYLKLNHVDVSYQNHFFVTRNDYKQQLITGGEYLISAWFSVIERLKESHYIEKSSSVILIGDVLDILRAKNIKSMRSRDSRMKFQIRKLLHLPFEKPVLDTEAFVSLKSKELTKKAASLIHRSPELKELIEWDEETFEATSRKDIKDLVDFIVEKTNPKDQLNLEEAYNILLWGRKTMGTQVMTFKGEFRCFVMMSNRHLVKRLLRYDPLMRFEDVLTHRLLRSEGFNELSGFPTSQIPFVPYKTNLYLKYILWTYRSKIDQKRIKKGKGRLVKHLELKKYYENPINEAILIDFLKDVRQKELPLQRFYQRKTGEKWPLGEMDINRYSFLLKLLSEQRR